MFSSTWLFLLPKVDTNARFPVLTAANNGCLSQPVIRRTLRDIERIAKVFGRFFFVVLHTERLRLPVTPTAPFDPSERGPRALGRVINNPGLSAANSLANIDCG
jgi:hypothetical protein